MKQRAGSLKRSIKLRSLQQDWQRKRKKERIQIISIRNKAGDFTTDTIDTKMIIRKCYEQLYTHKFDNLDEIYPFLEKYKLPQLTQYKTDNLKNSVTIKEIEFVVFKTHPPTECLQAQIVPGSRAFLCIFLLFSACRPIPTFCIYTAWPGWCVCWAHEQ